MRKNFILVTFLFLFINILGFANEKSKDIDVISILDKEREASYFILNFSSFTESKEIMDYINTNINKKPIAKSIDFAVVISPKFNVLFFGLATTTPAIFNPISDI